MKLAAPTVLSYNGYGRFSWGQLDATEICIQNEHNAEAMLGRI